jgi:hypothetical protein
MFVNLLLDIMDLACPASGRRINQNGIDVQRIVTARFFGG